MSIGGRLFLFRTADEWTLLSVRHHTSWDEAGNPRGGNGFAYVRTFPDLAQLRVHLQRDYYGADEWRALVEAGQATDPALRELWIPVQIDRDLERTSAHRRDLAEDGASRREGWEAGAFALGVHRLERLGFVVLTASRDVEDVFGHVPDWPGGLVVGAAAVDKYGYRADVLVAIDGFGEIYARTPDTSFDPGAPRRYPPRRLTESEARVADDTNRRRCHDQRRRSARRNDR
jgi:hypothetical protein